MSGKNHQIGSASRIIWTDLGGAQDLFGPFLKAEVALCDVSPLSALQVNQLAKSVDPSERRSRERVRERFRLGLS